MPTQKALLLSGYHSISQKTWADYVVKQCDSYAWQSICLPARYFSWRMRGAPLSIAAANSDLLGNHYDLIVATSSIDLSVVQSIYPALRNTPSILYFHENQFAYPTNNQPASVVDWQMVNLYSAMRADKLIFNSHFNQTSFLSGVRALLKKLPDLVPPKVENTLLEKSSILPVPIKAPPPSTPTVSNKKKPLRILWNHRWEWDKNPELLLLIVEKLDTRNCAFELILTGQQFRKIPDALEALCLKYSNYIHHTGFIESTDAYRALISSCDIVLSTAIHEFQGIAIMEAASQGCIPLLPDRLSYPEFFRVEHLYKSTGSLDKQADSAVNKIEHWVKRGLPRGQDLSELHEENLLNAYRDALTK